MPNPTLNIIRLDELTEQIKKEARVKGSDNLDEFIRDTINELLLDYCEKIRYMEMLMLNQPFTLIAAYGQYALLTAFQSLHRLRYKVGTEGSFYTLKERPTYVENTTGGRPRYYELQGNTLHIFPYDQVKTDDVMEVDYYKYPTELVDPTDVFPIPKLIVPLKKQAIYRVHVYNQELQVAGAFGGSSAESEVRSRRSSTNG